MPSTTYLSRLQQMLASCSSLGRAGILVVAIVTLSRATDIKNQNWSAPAEQLAGEIVSVTGPEVLALTVTNRSSLAGLQVDQIRHSLIEKLSSLGGHVADAGQASASVEVLLSENAQSYVWVAQIRQGSEPAAVVIISLPRSEAMAVTREVQTVILSKTLLWSQEDKILDARVMDGTPSHLTVLDVKQVSVYRMQSGLWLLEQSFPVLHAKPWPRDAQGKLRLRPDRLLAAYLPGVICQTASPVMLAMECRPSDDPWPLDDAPTLSGFFASTRNFFTGALSPGIGKQKATAAFYSVATLPREKYTLWIFAAVDGQIHLLDGIADQSLGKLKWGSEIASIHSGCGSGWQVLTSGNGNGATDTVRAFEFQDREPLAVSLPLDFAGTITALSADSGAGTAIAITHNFQAGRYEVNQITIRCGQ